MSIPETVAMHHMALSPGNPEIAESYEMARDDLIRGRDQRAAALDAREGKELEDWLSSPPPAPDTDDHKNWLSMTWADQRAIDTVFANVGKAIAAYERKLVSRNSDFDVFVDGLVTGELEKLEAITPAAQRGLKLFVGRANCRLCHSGPNLSDGTFHNTRIPPFAGGSPRDTGRYSAIDQIVRDQFNAAGAFTDEPTRQRGARLRRIHKSPHLWGEFKTPSLRNVALTAPYMHQGQLADLAAVLKFYSTLENALPLNREQEEVLAPLNLSESELADLQAFLESLTDSDVDPSLLVAPSSPILPRTHNGRG